MKSTHEDVMEEKKTRPDDKVQMFSPEPAHLFPYVSCHSQATAREERVLC